MKTTQTRATTFSEERAQSRQVLERAGKAQRRQRFCTRNQRGVALREHSKRPERGQPCPREGKSRDSRTKLSTLLSVAASWPQGVVGQSSKPTALVLSAMALMTGCRLLLCPSTAHAQGGVPLWTNVFRAPPQDRVSPVIAVDGSGNLFLAANSWNGSNVDFVTIKYSNTGSALWTNYYNGTGDAYDAPVGVALDKSGNIYVAGTSSNGSDRDFVTLKYSNTGVPLWTNRYDGPAQWDEAQAVAVDSKGSVFVSGFSNTDPTGGPDGGPCCPDVVVIAYSSAGAPVWTNSYNGPANDTEYGAIMTVDKNDDILVTMSSYTSQTQPFDIDYATVKFSSAGDLLWANRYDGRDTPEGNSPDQPTAIAVDNNGNVVVSGISANGGRQDYATIKYSAAGIPLWTNLYNGPANGYDLPNAIAIDTNGSVFVTGSISPLPIGNFDFGTVAYSSEGSLLWIRRYGDSTTSGDAAMKVAVDTGGNVIVTGSSGDGTKSHLVTLAYSNTGVPLWTNRFNRSATSFDSATSLALDLDGNVFVSGFSYDGTNTDYVTIKYSSSVPPPHLDFQPLNNELVLSWTDAGFNLQTAPAVTGTFTNLPGATSPYTNVTSGVQQFFRLKQE